MTKLLGIIEQRIGELVDIHNIATNEPISPLKPEESMGDGASSHLKAAARAGGSDKKSSSNNGAANLGGGFPFRPMPPTVDDFGDSDNDDQQDDSMLRPCKISEIQEKTAAAVGRRKEKQQTRTKR